MHHESEQSDELRRHIQQAHANLAQQLGATGNFPGGQLTSTDEGELALGVTAYKGKVVMQFGKPIAWLGMSPEQARALALLLRQHANQIERTPGL